MRLNEFLAEVNKHAPCSSRQVDHWYRKGYLRHDVADGVPQSGTGNWREYDPREVPVAQVLAEISLCMGELPKNECLTGAIARSVRDGGSEVVWGPLTFRWALPPETWGGHPRPLVEVLAEYEEEEEDG